MRKIFHKDSFRKFLSVSLVMTILLTSSYAPTMSLGDKWPLSGGIIQAKSEKANQNSEKVNEKSNKPDKNTSKGTNEKANQNKNAEGEIAGVSESSSAGKVRICHVPPGNPDNAHTIEISVNALDTHKEHHDDYEGACDDGVAPEGTVLIKNSAGEIIEYTNDLTGLYTEYSAEDFGEGGKKVNGVIGARFSNDGFNWKTISNLPTTDLCYDVMNTDNEIETVEECNEWDGSILQIPLENETESQGDHFVEGRYYKYLEVSDGYYVTVVSTSFIYDITPPSDNGFVLIGNSETDESNPENTRSLTNHVVYRAWDNSNPTTLPGEEFGFDFYAGVGYVRFSKDGSTYTDWQTYDNGILRSYLETWSDDPALNIYMQVRDKAGNVGTFTFEDSINYGSFLSGILGKSDTETTKSLVGPCDGARFKDVCPDHTFYTYIENLAGDGIINGYPRGYPGFPDDGIYFGPGNSLDRGAMAKFIKNAFEIPTDTSCGDFPDVDPSHTFYVYITSLKCAGIVNGYTDNHYKPGNLVTRGQTTKFVVNAINYKEGIDLERMIDLSTSEFPDVRRSNTFYTQINILANLYVDGVPIISGSGGRYYPDADINRGQMSKIVDLGRRYTADYITTACGTQGTSQVFGTTQRITSPHMNVEIDISTDLWDKFAEKGGIETVGFPVLEFGTELERRLDERFPNVDPGGTEPDGDWIDGMLFERGIIGVDWDPDPDDKEFGWMDNEICTITSASRYTESQLREIIEDAYKLELIDDTSTWSEVELEWILEVLEMVGKDYYYKKVNLLDIYSEEIELDFPLKKLERKSDGPKGAYSQKFKRISISDSYPSSSWDEFPMRTDEEKFKFTFLHELTHAFQRANHDIALNFVGITWDVITDSTTDSYDTVGANTNVVKEGKKVCDFSGWYTLNSIEEMADAYAMHYYIGTEGFQRRYNLVKNLTYEEFNTWNNLYISNPSVARYISECKDRDRVLDYSETDIFIKDNFNYNLY